MDPTVVLLQSFSASDCVPDSYRLVGTVDAGLRKCRLGRSSCLPVPASSVGDERGCTAHLRPASLRPHLRRTHQPPLVLRGTVDSKPGKAATTSLVC